MPIPDALPHGDLEEVLPEVFFVTGTSRPTFQGLEWQFSRNMVVVRHAGGLTLINSVRLDDRGLAALDALGPVTALVRLGAFHGYDDAFYLARSAPRYFGLAGAPDEGARAPDVCLEPGGEVPVPGAEIFRFETSRVPEAILRLPVAGGALVSCDALQNWLGPDRFFDAASAERMRAYGFFAPANIGPGWRMAAQPERRDFDRLSGLQFAHLLPAHGTPLLHDARAQIAATVARAFPEG